MTETALAPLTIEDFPGFFQEVHGHNPFPWQSRLLEQAADKGWPAVLDLPTGSGKTAALDVAIFHLALEAGRGGERRAPVRIAFVVDRRLVVDDAFARAERIEAALKNAELETVAGRVAARLRILAGKDAPPLLARRLRGGLPREDSWARTPSQPVILCSTVDQVGSRLLFRGYGVSDRMKPVHAGLMGSDCLIFLDEAHLSEPFRQTLEWVARYKSPAWREECVTAPWSVVTLSATPGRNDTSSEPFSLNERDREDETLNRRLGAPKLARLVPLEKAKNKRVQSEPESDSEADIKTGDELVVKMSVYHAQEGLKELQKNIAAPALAVVVNRVQRARVVFDELQMQLADRAEAILLIGPARQVEKDVLAKKLDPIHTGRELLNGRDRILEKPLVIVATQCIEAGVDIDLDGLITEAAPLDALRQRFGRLNRSGRAIDCFAAIVEPAKLKKGSSDPVYGDAIQETWKYLLNSSEKSAGKKKEQFFDFGLNAFQQRLDAPEENSDQYRAMLSPKDDAPVLMPAHLDLLAQTSPIPAADPEISLYLHGPRRSADAVTVVWRADIDPAIHKNNTHTYRLFTLMPPRAAEAIELPVWAVRRWLTTKTGLDSLADVPVTEEDDDLQQRNKSGRPVFLWAGDEDRSQWIDNPRRIRPGATIVVPACYGGIDKYGWKPDSQEPVRDAADEAAEMMQSRRYAVRIARGLLDENGDEKKSGENAEALAAALAAHAGEGWQDLRQAVLDAVASTEFHDALGKLDRAKGKGRDKVQVELDCYGRDEKNRPRGIVFFVPRGLKPEKKQNEQAETLDLDSIATTEDDFVGTLPGFNLLLEDHSRHVADKAAEFARAASLPENSILDFRIAGLLHDTGKADARFQALLAYSDPLGPDPKNVLAKSARRRPLIAHDRSQLPLRWRHEALSVRLAPWIRDFEQVADKELVLWLIGTHHGFGRPFFPHADPEDNEDRASLPQVLGIPSALPAGAGPQSLAYETKDGLDWFSLFERLKARYGIWELARMEAILRLADHRASEEAASRAHTTETENAQ